MSSTSRAALRRARSKQAAKRSKKVFVLTTGAVVLLFAVAVLLTRPSDEADAPGGLQEVGPVSVMGGALPAFDAGKEDPAVGMTMPAISGEDFSGRRVSIPDDGRPKVVLFLAHWCPHCQAEVPVVQGLIDQGALPRGVDIYSVATATDEAQPNYPPSSWLSREGWTAPVIVDDALSSAGEAAGVTSYPFFVFVDGDGTVHHRAAGELSPETLEAAIAELL